MPSSQATTFADPVRIRTTPVTRELGLAGMRGEVRGFTAPSALGIEVVGERGNLAFQVLLDGQNEPVWFAPELVEF